MYNKITINNDNLICEFMKVTDNLQGRETAIHSCYFGVYQVQSCYAIHDFVILLPTDNQLFECTIFVCKF